MSNYFKDGSIVTGGNQSTKTFGVIGDSISSDQDINGNQAWVRGYVQMAGNPTLSRQTLGGKRIYTGIIPSAAALSADCDMVVVAMGRNDIQNYTLGDIPTIMAADLASLATSETVMGRYRYALETLKARLHSNAIIVCVAPITECLIDSWANSENADKRATYAYLASLRQAIKDFVIAEGNIVSGWMFLDGSKIFTVDDSAAYYCVKQDGTADSTHPNKAGQAIMAGWYYTHLPNINLIERGGST